VKEFEFLFGHRLYTWDECKRKVFVMKECTITYLKTTPERAK
jgi:hypothetical protein